MVGSAGGCPPPFSSTPAAVGLRCEFSHLEQRGKGIKWEKSEREDFSVKKERIGLGIGGWRRYEEEKGDEGERNWERGSEGGLGGWCVCVQRDGCGKGWGEMES